MSYGFGQEIKRYTGLLLIGHEGADTGYRTYIGRFPQQQFAIILLGNFEAFEPEKVAMKITNIYLSNQLSPLTKDDAVTEKKLLTPETIEQAISGQYQIDNNRILRIFVVDRNIIGEIKNEKRRFDLIPLSNTDYENKSEGINIKYFEEKNRITDSIRFTKKKTSSTLTKLLTLDLTYLNEYAGNFYCKELDAKYTVKIQGNHLVAILPRNNPVIITQNESDSFFGSCWWIRDIKFIRDKANKITGFEVNNGRAKKIKFSKIEIE